MSKDNVIFIIIDQLSNLNNLPQNVKDQLPGYNSFLNKCINLNKNYVTGVPCSASRASIYTGKHMNITKMSDNNNNSWQPDLPTVEEGLNTIGTYFKNKGYKTRYMGKWHMSKDLDPVEQLKFKPTISNQDYLIKYGFDVYDKKGDAGFGRHGGFFSDLELLEQRLPNGNDPDKCDYYDDINKIGYDGLFPYLKQNLNSNVNINTNTNMNNMNNVNNANEKPFLCIVNFRNPHDITYNDTISIENNPTSGTATMQLSGNPDNDSKTNSLYNNNYRLFRNLPLINDDTIQNDNVIDSTLNDPLYVARLYYLATKFYAYGISKDNLLSYQYYQNSYLQMIKQLDTQLEEMYKFFVDNKVFDKCVIIIGSDHGELNGEHGLIGKGSMIYNGEWNVTTLISYPNMPQEYKGMLHNYVTSNIQLTSTALLLSNSYTKDEIKELGLFKPFFRMSNCGELQIIKKDFKCIKLNLSIGYGPIFSPLLKSLRSDVVDTEVDQYLLPTINYFTVPGFSISSIINFNGKYYNVGYYFSIYNLFISNRSNKTINLPSGQFILYNSLNPNGIAFVGTSEQLYLQYFANSQLSSQYLINGKIEPLTSTSLDGYKQIGVTPFGSTIYSSSALFTNINISTILNITKPTLPSSPHILYNAKSGGSLFCFVGTLPYLTFMKATDPLLKVLNWESQISPYTGTLLTHFNTYVMNDPIYQNAEIYSISTVTKQSVILNFSLSKILPLIMNLSDNDLSDVILGGIVYDNLNSIQFIINTFLSNLTTYKTPGLDMTIQQLLQNKIQVQIFNITDDPTEKNNLANIRSIPTNIQLISKLLSLLYNYIRYNGLDNIYVALPKNLVFAKIFSAIKKFMNTDVPQVYSGTMLESNFFNKVK